MGTSSAILGAIDKLKLVSELASEWAEESDDVECGRGRDLRSDPQGDLCSSEISVELANESRRNVESDLLKGVLGGELQGEVFDDGKVGCDVEK